MSDPFVSSLMLGATLFLLIVGVGGLFACVPPDDRTDMDPLPAPVRLIWPLVRLFTWFAGSRLPVDTLQKIQRDLQRVGLDYTLTPDQFSGLQMTSTLLVTLFVLAVCLMLPAVPMQSLLFAPVLGFLYPRIWMRDLWRRRQISILKTLPTYLDFICMAIEAGLNLSGAINQAVDKGPEGPLQFEFARVIRDIRAGLPRADAMRRMANRIDIDPIHSFVSSVIQVEQTGGGLSGMLKIMAEQRRQERFQRAEKLALEAPVKLMGPLVLFIFPLTFIVLGFPLVMKFLAQGTL
jgi:tight adherence protein C